MVGLVLEGGGQRCMYSAAIIDAMMQHGITVDGIVGVSAGSAFGVNMKSGQMGRALRYNKKFCNDPRYTSLKALITTGNLYTEDFCYGTVPRKLDVFDTDAFTKSPINTGRCAPMCAPPSRCICRSPTAATAICASFRLRLPCRW